MHRISIVYKSAVTNMATVRICVRRFVLLCTEFVGLSSYRQHQILKKNESLNTFRVRFIGL